ncbi:glycosyl hydrolase family 8 [Pseudobacteroides cellulosolvens]|uniref:Glycoside hydrolase family 8 n=1 Tax=Pseudobacteroides cellulosolvens ATCC 35603 = DSM 2933 TaxID=398512 RepID=A0A0L6JI86_9FIRM|nr:glycosyl hydrolase family 8 [Pseudobacteroides cellulosolvens]KNY25430.1 glycoside hydrolase family 8 [Pseudobacteroides cellulosolvens ATCC 35603 = DSM 2933]
MKIKKLLSLVLICSIIATYFVQAGVQSNAATPVIPAQGAFETGVYRNLFKEAGHTDAEIKAKLEKEFQSLFHGDSNHKIMYEVGSDMAYILDVNNNDIRSEGQSYGMMHCVQMDKKTEFDKLWKWAKTYMQQKSGQFKGFFAWQCRTDGSHMDETPASDGDEYFAMALLFASKRWGNGTGIFNYEAEANAILDACLHQSDDGQGYNLINKNSNQVVFCPSAGNYDFTDPSYHLPGFYELFALWGPEKDRETWKKVAATSREFFKKTTHPTTGLAPDYANFDGSPKSVSWGTEHVDFRYDAWRTVNNSAFDFAWFKKDAWASTYADRIQDFFVSKGRTTYGGCYKLDGTQLNTDHSPGLVAMNAVASLAATKAQAYDFVEDLWKLSAPSGQYRYYDGCLFMFGLLHVSGNFRIWGAAEPTELPSDTPTPTKDTSGPAVKGDLNNDGVINMADVILIATAFNATSGSEKYKAAYDLNNDGAINMADVLTIAQNFNKSVTQVSTNPPTATATSTKAPTPTPTKPSSNPNAKLIALTFDDGPDNTKTARVLDKLDKYKVPATFMMIGQNISSGTANIIKRVVSSGHEIGNHSWDYSSMNNMSSTQVKDYISRTNAAISQYAGVTPKFFRAPNLAYSQTMYDAIDLTFVQGVTCNDWVQSSSATDRANAVIAGAKDGTIILMHDNQPDPHPTPEALDIIIPRLQSQGYEFVTLSELFQRKGVTLRANDNIAHTTLPN